MARDTDTVFQSSEIWALTGDRSAPGFPLNTGWGAIYEQDPNLGGAFLSRDTFNYNFYRLSLLANMITVYGSGLEWGVTIPYVMGATCVGSDGTLYFAKTANTGIDPVSDGGVNWASIASAVTGVNTVFGRFGTVVAESGDYTASQVTNVANGNISSTDVQAAINELDMEKIPFSLADNKGDIIVASTDNTFTIVPVGPDGYVLKADSAESEGVKWGPETAFAPVDSVFGRTGNVVAAASDYDADQVDYTSPANTTVHTNVDEALNQSVKYAATSGQVKVNSYNGVAEDKPSQTITTTAANVLFGPFTFEYGANLNFSSSPTNQFPIMDPNKNDASIWDDVNKKFRENNSLGQQTFWRFIFSYTRTSFQKVQVVFRLRNPDTGFETSRKIYFSEERIGATDTGFETIELITIADNASLDPNRGYFLEALIYGDNGASIDLELDSTTRISLPNSNEGTA